MGPIALGSFRLLAPLAQSAAGQVWRGLHEATRLPVAVKLFPETDDPRQRRLFQREARAVAALDHPHVIGVLGLGEVDEAAATDGRLAPGTPWMALEYASGGSWSDARPTSFQALQSQLVQLLDALAHAHARGVIHGDLKPSNVLIAGPRDARPGLKLSDFGVARHDRDDPDPTLLEAQAGTPAFMSPEQILGTWELEPSSDLYALGCVVWHLCTGRSPFQREQAMATVRAHLEDPLPPFLPAFPVPSRLTSWLEALLARDPRARPQRAADALAALVDLHDEPTDEDDELTMSMGLPNVDPDEPTQYGFDTLDDVATSMADDDPVPVAIGPPPHLGPATRANPPWPRVMRAASVGLIGRRELPAVGRDVAQRALWEELRQVHLSRRPRAVVVRGPAGIGRTHLLTWLARRADEVGGARCLALGGERDTLRGGLAKLLGVRGCEADARRTRLASWFGTDEEVSAVQTLLDGQLEGAAARGALLHALSRVARERPLLLLVDDAHGQREALALVRELVHRDVAVLAALGVDEARLGPGTPEALDVDALEAHEVHLGPLPDVAVRQLLEDVVGLEAGLAGRLTAQVKGRPLQLWQLLAATSSRGGWTAGPRGIELPAGLPPRLPDDLAASWLLQIDELLEAHEPAWAWDLGVAATFGEQVRIEAWHTACDDPDGEGMGWSPEGLTRRRELLDALAAAQLVSDDGSGFRFVHRLLRDALVDRARARGVWPHLAEACANALRLHGQGGAELGRMLRAAGRPEAALLPLLDGARELLPVAPRAVIPLLAEAEDVASEATLPPQDPLSGELLVLRAQAHLGSGEREEALRWAGWAQQAAKTHGPHQRGQAERRWWEHLRTALQVEHQALWALERRDEAAAVLPRLAPVVRKLGDALPLGDLLLAQAQLHAGLPDGNDAARSLLDSARESFEQARRPDRLARVRLLQSELALARGEPAAAALPLDEALRDGTSGDQGLHGRVLAARAEVALLSGDVDDAAALFDRATAALRSVDRPTARVELLRGLCASLLGHTAEGAARSLALGDEPPGLSRGLHGLVLAITEARMRRWAGVEERLRGVERAPPRPSPLVAWLAQRLASESEIAGFAALARRALALRDQNSQAV